MAAAGSRESARRHGRMAGSSATWLAIRSKCVGSTQMRGFTARCWVRRGSAFGMWSSGGAQRRWWAVRSRSAAVLLALALVIGACDGGSDPAEALRWCVANPEDVAAEVLDPSTGVATAAANE